jgi:hypothetical protein
MGVYSGHLKLAVANIGSAITEAIGLRTSADGETVSCCLAISDAVQNIFHLGVGAGKMDFTSEVNSIFYFRFSLLSYKIYIC